MSKQREIDHVVVDPSFEVREGRLSDLLHKIIADTGKSHTLTTLAEISGTTFLSLLLTIVSVDKFKAFGGLSSENVYGAVIALLTICLGTFLVSGTRLLLSKPNSVEVPQLIAALKEPELVANTPVRTHEQVKIPQKLSGDPDPIFLLLSYLNDRQGASPIAEIESFLHTLGMVDKAVEELIDHAIASGFLLSKEKILYLTRTGNEYYRHAKELIERKSFFNSNLDV